MLPILSRAIVCGVCLVFAANLRAESPYWVMFRDGRQLAGETMHFWHGGQESKLDGHRLFDEADPPRVIRRSGVSVRLKGPWIEFRNGDVLPGRVDRYHSPASPDAPAAFSVAIEQPSALIPVDSGEVRVRADQARVLVWDHRRRLLRYEPGAVLFRDGRRVDCRAIRLAPHGARLLTDQGLVEAAWGELSEMHLPDRQYNVAEMQLRWLAWAEENMLLESLLLAGGARLTFPQGTTEMETHYRSERFAYCAVQPQWSLDPLYFDPEQAAVSVYRRLNEVPLSLLPVTTERQEATFHSWAWQRDRNVHGDLLACGPLTVSEGFGVHGNTTLAVELPSQAVSIAGWAGVDRVVGRHGAVKCKLLGDSGTAEPLWESGVLRGGEPAVAFGPIDIRSVRRLLLAAEEAAEEHLPPGSDPFDIGDDLCWLLTTVTLAADAAIPGDLAGNSLDHWIPELGGWQVAADSAPVRLFPIWSENESRWRYSLGVRSTEEESEQIRLLRRLRVSMSNAFLYVSAGSIQRHAGHEVTVWVGDQQITSTMNGDLKTNRRAGDFDSRVYILGDYAGQEIELSLRIERADPRPSGSGVYFEAAELRPLVQGLPATGEPLRATVALMELTPLAALRNGEAWELRSDGTTRRGLPLTIRGYPLQHGLAMPNGAEATYQLDPQWRRFVAIAGLAAGGQRAGPFEILIDGQQHYISSDPAVLKHNTPGLQVNVPIPLGSRTITLKVGGRSGIGAWGEAGFRAD